MSQSENKETKTTSKCDYCNTEREIKDLNYGSYWYSGSRSGGHFCNDKPCLQFMNMGGH